MKKTISKKIPLERQTTLGRFMDDSVYKDKIKELTFLCIKEKTIKSEDDAKFARLEK